MIPDVALEAAVETVAGRIGMRRIQAGCAEVAAVIDRRVRQTGAVAVVITGVAGQLAMIDIAEILTVGRVAGTYNSRRPAVVNISIYHALVADRMISGVAGEFAGIAVAVWRGMLGC